MVCDFTNHFFRLHILKWAWFHIYKPLLFNGFILKFEIKRLYSGALQINALLQALMFLAEGIWI